MEDITMQTFGRVDGENFIDEIATYEYEDNYSYRNIYAVLKQKDGKYTIVIQMLADDPDPEAEWPKAIVVAKDIVDENDAIKRCEEMFRLD